MSDCFVLYLLLTCMKKKTSGADKFTNNTMRIRNSIYPAFMPNGEIKVLDAYETTKK